MELDQQLENARAKLTSIREGREKDLQKYKQELAQRELKGERADSLEAFRTWVNNYEVNTAKDIEAREAEIAALEIRVNQESYQLQRTAREHLEAMKGPALEAWLKYGGSSDDFENAWPRIKFEHLKQMVLEDLAIMAATGRL